MTATKKPSGAEFKKRRRAAAAAERKRKKTPSTLTDVGAPPLDDTASLITWGAQALASTIHRAMQDPSIFESEAQQLRFVADGCAKLGMIRDKAAEQAQIKKALQKMRGDRHEAELTPIKSTVCPRVERPRE